MGGVLVGIVLSSDGMDGWVGGDVGGLGHVLWDVVGVR